MLAARHDDDDDDDDFYANLSFQILINSKSISTFYLFLQGSTVIRNYSICLFAFKALIMYSSDFTKIKYFMHSKMTI